MLLNKSSFANLTSTPRRVHRLNVRANAVSKVQHSSTELTTNQQHQQQGSRFAAITETAPAPPSQMTPGVIGGMAAMMGAGILISKATSGGSGGQNLAQLQGQQAALAAQLQAQQAATQAALLAQQNQIQAAQAAQLAHALETAGMTPSSAAAPKPVPTTSLEERLKAVQQYFPTALPVDDYMNRVELALSQLGFTGNNTIAMSNLCRDESCMILEDKIESVFGACFSTHGLGGVLTCGSIGIKAGLSHSPIVGSKEQYVFFSFPHIAIDSANEIGKISRPNRPGPSSACGALCACLADFQKDGVEANCRVPGVHDAENPEYSILKQRLARQLKSEDCDPSKLDLVSITQAAERTITNDLEHLISQAVDPTKANYAVFTGVQIHNWASDLTDSSIPSLEFVASGKSYTVIDGVKKAMDVTTLPALAPRQLRLLGAYSEEQHPDNGKMAFGSSIQEIPRGYLLRRVGGAAGTRYVQTPDVPRPW
ncbi:hypothetical protein DUNSADRAFT_3284 [Dunaliella salina]|uniref:Limiting CO2-inducible protein B/C beta carbonyic anhydrase domain-containing protein n=1 Tax=Dunaliella salina TaxID=3046 RepID=A0ABQ7GU94_DUNSA|nr:hypothetical protein DUNSADRAFT_3284 [Dunaliella salina]|eukprot:KAF5838159.1 hypothetical protein DUNSADRAFT_3284 [Dunaliella salina]